MTLKQITEDNFSSLLRSIDPSPDLLGRLRSVPFVKHRVSAIKQRSTVDAKNDALLDTLIEVPEDIEESVMNGFISALRSSGQHHVANIFRRETDKVIMSDEHYEVLSTKRLDLCQFMNPTDPLLHRLISLRIFSSADKRKITSRTGLNDMADETIEVLLRKSDDAFHKFITSLRETGQSHVAYILTGEGNCRPLKEEHRRKLLSGPRDDLVNEIDSKHSGLITALMSKGVFTGYDEQRITSVQPNTQEDRNEMILNLIARKSQTDFLNFISALNDTDQTHVVVQLVGVGVVAKIKTIYESRTHNSRIADVDAELLEYMQTMFQQNGVVVRRLNRILSQNGLSVSDVREGCIQVTFACSRVESSRHLRDLYSGGELGNMFSEAFCSHFVQKGLISLQLEIPKDHFEQCAQEFVRWIPMNSEHRKQLLLSAELFVDKMTVNDDLLDKLSLCRRRREAIKSAATHKQQVNTLLDIVSRLTYSAFTQLFDALNDTQQTEAASIISRDTRSAKKSQPSSYESSSESYISVRSVEILDDRRNSSTPHSSGMFMHKYLLLFPHNITNRITASSTGLTGSTATSLANT